MTFWDFIQWVLSGFWRFVGAAILLNVFMFYTVNGIVQTVRALKLPTKEE